MKRIKYVLAILWLLILIPDGKTQDLKLSKNSIFIEIFGNGGYYSINYERSLKPNLYGRIGFSSYRSKSILGSENVIGITTFPVLITYFTGQKMHHFEIGGGMLLGNVNEDNVSNTIIDLTAFLGYRVQSPGNGMLIRIGLTPFLSLDNKANYPDKLLTLSGGISLGYHF